MFDSLDTIRRQLLAGEDSFAEFKEVRLGGRSVISPNSEQFAGELVAFANADGGVVFLGVSDDGSVQGLPAGDLDRVEQWVVNIASNGCDPPIRPVIRRVRMTGQGTEGHLLLVELHRGLFAHRTSGGRWLVRIGSTKRDLTAQELARLLQERGRAFVFDEQAVMSATLDDLDDGVLDRHFGPSAIPRSDLLRNTRVAVADDGGTDRPTVAGLLAFGRDPQQHLMPAHVHAGVYRGTRLDSDELVHSMLIGGTAADQIDDAVRFVDRFMLRPARKKLGRIEYPQYALDPVYEAVVNAVAHRDYSVSGSKIRLFLFTDRLELYSPGALPNTLTLETLPYRVFTRNQLLVSFLSRMRSAHNGSYYLESRGEGVRRILEQSEKHSGRRPEYRLLGDELLLTIWAQPSPHASRDD